MGFLNGKIRTGLSLFLSYERPGKKGLEKEKEKKRRVVCYGAVADTGGCGTSW